MAEPRIVILGAGLSADGVTVGVQGRWTLFSGGALDSVRNEVRVGQKPRLNLLDAEREALVAQSALVAARGEAAVSSYRLNALLHGQ